MTTNDLVCRKISVSILCTRREEKRKKGRKKDGKSREVDREVEERRERERAKIEKYKEIK